jgi:hypothetical protein
MYCGTQQMCAQQNKLDPYPVHSPHMQALLPLKYYSSGGAQSQHPKQHKFKLKPEHTSHELAQQRLQQ